MEGNFHAEQQSGVGDNVGSHRAAGAGWNLHDGDKGVKNDSSQAMAQTKAQGGQDETSVLDLGNPVDPVRSDLVLDTQQPGTNRSYSPMASVGGNYPTTGNLALKPDLEFDNVVEFSPKPKLQVVEPKPAKAAKPVKAAKVKAAKVVSTKEEADWLRKLFPLTIEGASGSWSVRPDDAGFAVYFRVKTPTINQRFPRISREVFLTLKGMSDAERKAKTQKYVRGHLRDAIERGDGKARAVAGKLRISS